MVNEDTTGTVDGLQRQLKQLRQELLAARAVISANGGTIPRGLALEAAASASEEGEAGGKGPVSARSRAELKRTEALLRDALDRCLRLEEARGVAEAMAGNVQETVTRLEQALMNEKMARKMKESQVRSVRLRVCGSEQEPMLTTVCLPFPYTTDRAPAEEGGRGRERKHDGGGAAGGDRGAAEGWGAGAARGEKRTRGPAKPFDN